MPRKKKAVTPTQPEDNVSEDIAPEDTAPEVTNDTPPVEEESTSSGLPPHIVCAEDERAELSDKLDKLVAFLKTDEYRALSNAERTFLQHQKNAMVAYHDFVAQRIALYK